ncbi:MAG: hypothetical protein WBL70_08850 [Candidatus Acidiferrales bacterium]
MPIFSRLFGGRPVSPEVQEIIDKARANTENELKPLRDLTLALICASVNCRDGIKHLIKAPTEKERQLAEIYAFDEFIYFFMHHAMRVASGVMSEREVKHLQEHLGPLIASTAIDSYWQHWPDEIKSGLIVEFYKNLNAAEVQYATCSQFNSPAPPEGRSLQILEALFASLGERVASAVGQGGNRELSLLVSSLARREFSPTSLLSPIAAFKRDSVGL